MKVNYSYTDVVIVVSKTCYVSIAPMAYFVPITLFCFDSLFFRLSKNIDFFSFTHSIMLGCIANYHSSNKTIAFSTYVS